MPLLLVFALAGAGAGVATAQDEEGKPPTLVFAKDGEDARGRLDIARVALARDAGGGLRAEITMYESWDATDLAETVAEGSTGVSTVCWKLWTKNDPTSEPANYLVCLTANADGDELVGRVLRERLNGPPITVGDARVSRPTERSAYARFTRTQVGKPAQIRFQGEVVTREKKCPRPLGCVDEAPNIGRTAVLALR